MLTRKNLIITTATLLLIILPLAATSAGQPYLISFSSRILIYALAAVSLDLLIGYSGLISLGHAAFVGIGGYVAAICHYHSFEMTPLFSWPFTFTGSDQLLLVFPLAMVVSAFFALIIGALSLRTKGMHFIMITLAFAQMLYYFFTSLDTYGGADGLSLFARNRLPGLDLGDDVQFYYLCLTALVLFVIFSIKLVQSRFGLIIRGAGNNDRRIKGLGIHSSMYKLTIFVIGGAGAGLAGALLANHTEYVSPSMMHWTLSGELMVMVLLGGIGSLFGPILGASLFLLLEEVLASYTEHWMIYMGPLLILAVIYAKRGIFGLLVGESKRDD